MVKISRYFLVIMGILGFATVLPKLYWIAFDKPVRKPLIMYSCIKNDFFILKNENGKTILKDAQGNNYSQEKFEQNLPLMYASQLIMNNSMPDTINGVRIENSAITDSRKSIVIQPKDISPSIHGLYPLFESQSGRANIVLPDDYFRITWRMEFIDVLTNRILEEKSRMFSAVLYKNGFKFPAKSINGIPISRKSNDEGYFIVDDEDQLFNVKMVKGEPFVKHVELPSGMTFKYICCVDFRDKKFYAYLFSTDNHIYILTRNDYQLIELPVGEMDVEKCEIRIFGDLFHYNVTAIEDNSLRICALNTDFKKIDEYSETWPGRKDTGEGRIFAALFPGQLSLTDPNSNFVKFYIKINDPFYWLFTGGILIFVQFFIIRKRKTVLKNNLADLVIIGITGIFGFIAINIFPNKFFD